MKNRIPGSTVFGCLKPCSHLGDCLLLFIHTAYKSFSNIPDADVVVIPAGVPRKPGMSRDDLFNTNASIVRDLAKSIAENSPKAIIAIITNPVNSMVPIASEVLKKVCISQIIRIYALCMKQFSLVQGWPTLIFEIK